MKNMNALFRKLSLIALIAVSLVACKKDDKEPETTNSANGFTWTENGGSTAQTATAATFSTGYKTLIATGAAGTVFEINLTGTTPGTYTLGSGNAITYTKVTPYFTPTTGNVIITTNSGGKISGTFQGGGTATAGITAVAGTFTDITVTP